MTTTNAIRVDGQTNVEVVLDPDEANAIVYAIAIELSCAGETLTNLPVSKLPGNLLTIGSAGRRVARLVAVVDQLKWRAHWGRNGGEPPAIEVPPAVLLEVAAALQERAADQEKYGIEGHPDGAFEFGRAAATVARAFAEAS